MASPTSDNSLDSIRGCCCMCAGNNFNVTFSNILCSYDNFTTYSPLVNSLSVRHGNSWHELYQHHRKKRNKVHLDTSRNRPITQGTIPFFKKVQESMLA
ncbi:Hypothetical predicted protein [Mytilus galloprovincialis]|uniref:Uncharacterized protein n=1 Tax=Mytilus galloprovincialis TaxID=29158 RepID=A0A8B6D346_MYTGA|nr:Hypothetical predicted protein [Mytilus galloprovincialis]